MYFFQSYTKVIKINLLLGNIAPQIRRKKNFIYQLTTKIKPGEHQQSKIIPKYPGQKIKYLLIYHSETQRDRRGTGGKCSQNRGPREGRGIQYCMGGTQVGEEIPATPTGMLLEPWVLRPHRRGVWGEGEEGHRPSGLDKQADGGGPPARQRCWAVSWGQGWMDGWTDGWMNSTRARGLFPMLGGGSVFSSAGVPDLGSKSGTGG